MQKKAKGVQESDIDEIIALIKSKDAFTREQIRGTLENFKGDKTETSKQLIFKICKLKRRLISLQSSGTNKEKQMLNRKYMPRLFSSKKN
jgi:hypothetical protein